jgi:hypothetical protein
VHFPFSLAIHVMSINPDPTPRRTQNKLDRQVSSTWSTQIVSAKNQAAANLDETPVSGLNGGLWQMGEWRKMEDDTEIMDEYKDLRCDNTWIELETLKD